MTTAKPDCGKCVHAVTPSGRQCYTMSRRLDEMTNELADKAHEVRILELEVQKLELGARIKQLKAEPTIDEEGVGCCKVVDVAANLQKELDECRRNKNKFEVTIHERDEEIDVKRTIIQEMDQRRMEDKTTIEYLKETLKLERLDHTSERTAVNRKYHDVIRERDSLIEGLRAGAEANALRIEDLKKTISDLREQICCLPDNFWAVVGKKNATISQQKNTIDELREKNKRLFGDGIKDAVEIAHRADIIGALEVDKEERDRLKYVISARDLTIKSLTTMCQSSGTERNKLTTELYSVKSDRDIMFQNYRNTIAKLKDDIKGLEAELSVRKEDSEVLLKVVEAVRQYDGSYKHGTMNTFDHVFDILVDYLDAPEGPEDTTIDEPPEITVTFDRYKE